MSYVIVRRESGVYDVEPFRTREEIAILPVVVRNGKAVTFEVGDDAQRECKAMNKERLKRFREAKKAQGKLFEEEA